MGWIFYANTNILQIKIINISHTVLTWSYILSTFLGAYLINDHSDDLSSSWNHHGKRLSFFFLNFRRAVFPNLLNFRLSNSILSFSSRHNLSELIISKPLPLCQSPYTTANDFYQGKLTFFVVVFAFVCLIFNFCLSSFMVRGLFDICVLKWLIITIVNCENEYIYCIGQEKNDSS